MDKQDTLAVNYNFVNYHFVNYHFIDLKLNYRDILVFCTGQEEIEYMVSMVKDVLPQLAFGIEILI